MKKNKKRNKMFLSAMLGKAMVIALLSLGLVLVGYSKNGEGGKGATR